MKQTLFRHACIWIIAILALALSARGQVVRPATAPAASVEGRVISPDGKPLAGARVSAYDASRLFRLTPLASEPSNLDGGYPRFGSTTTDANGHFRMDAPVLVQVIVAVQADGCGLTVEQCATDGLDDPLTIRMAPAFPAQVRVIDRRGRPVPNVLIAPTHIDTEAGTYLSYLPNQLVAELVQVSDADGMCTFPGLAASRRIVYQAQDDRFVASIGGVNQQRADAQPGDVQDFQVEPAGAIEGQVIFSDTGKSAAGMVVLAGEMIGTNGRWTTSVTTDDQGRFRVSRLRPGEVQLIPRLTSPDSGRYTATITTIPIEPPQTVVGQLLKLAPSPSSVHGQVTSNDVPVAGVTVTIVPDRNSVFENPSLPRAQEATTAADGSYQLALMPGQYSLTASAADRLNLFPVAQSNMQVAVTTENTTTADFQFQPGISPPLGTVEGTVVDEQDHPIEGAAIVGVVSRPQRGGAMIGIGNMARQMAAVLHTTSDANGKFSLNVIGPAVELYVRKKDAMLPQPVWVRSATERPRLVLKDTAGALVIHAVQADGQPVAGAPVRVGIRYNWRQFAPIAGMTEADGTFTVRPYFPDRGYSVSVSAPGFATTTQEFGTSSSPIRLLAGPGTTAEAQNPVEPGKTLDVTMKMLKTDSFIAGQVVDAAGKPLTDVQVNVSGSRGGTRSTRTDASGQFRMDGLVAGEQVNVSTFVAGARSGQSTRVVAGTGDAKIVHAPGATRAGGPRGGAPARGARGAP